MFHFHKRILHIFIHRRTEVNSQNTKHLNDFCMEHRRRFNVATTLLKSIIQYCIDVKTTSRAYWDIVDKKHVKVSFPSRNRFKEKVDVYKHQIFD